MNITHAKEVELSGDRLCLMFDRQSELMAKYHDIELRSGLMQTEDCPVNLNDKKGQARIKDFAWRVTEELGESMDAFYNEENLVHYNEELIDGLHFLIELTILSGKGPDFVAGDDWNGELGDRLEAIYSAGTDLSDYISIQLFSQHILWLGMMCNCLKNKPWKQTQMLTDEGNFYKYLKLVWVNYFGILSREMSSEDVFQIYFKKSEVNKFRQRSNY